jgi:hypothetical protein
MGKQRIYMKLGRRRKRTVMTIEVARPLSLGPQLIDKRLAELQYGRQQNVNMSSV